jgi:dynein assembly factor 1
MLAEDEEEEHQVKAITPQDIHDSCVKNQLYTFPELNETLYLHFGCFQRIASLEPYINLTSLWLNNNAINVIEGLSSLKQLVCLYLQGNVIERIEGLDELENLETLVLSSNYIKKIENLGHLTKLHTLEIDHNYISEASNLAGLLEAPSLGVLNLSFNKLETEDFIPIISRLDHLNLLKLEGNPIARFMSQYRRRLLTLMPWLQYLDDAPVFESEVRMAKAWSTGGRDAELEERRKIQQEKEDERTRNRKELRRANRAYAIEHGIDIKNDKRLMSSDDERLNKDSEDENEDAKKEEDKSDGDGGKKEDNSADIE